MNENRCYPEKSKKCQTSPRCPTSPQFTVADENYYDELFQKCMIWRLSHDCCIRVSRADKNLEKSNRIAGSRLAADNGYHGKNLSNRRRIQ